MADKPEQKIEQPKGLSAKPASKGAQAQIFSMPEQYRFGAADKMVKPGPKAPPQPQVQAPQPPPPPPKPAKKPAAKKPGMPPKKKGGGTKWLIIIGLIILLILGIGGYFFVQTSNQGTTPTSPTSPTTPTPTTPPPPPPPTTPPPTTPDPTEPFEGQVNPGVDTDSDGLTDLEERTVYSTNPRLPDSDSDGFLDGNEVFHRFNPGGLAPGTLLESGLVTEHTGPELPYTMLYPTAWGLERDPVSVRDAVFQITTGETITLTVMEKNVALSLQEWFTEQGIDETVVATRTVNGYSSLVSENQLMTFVDGGSFVMAFSYDTGIKGTVDYLQTFQMMINSIELK